MLEIEPGLPLEQQVLLTAKSFLQPLQEGS